MTEQNRAATEQSQTDAQAQPEPEPRDEEQTQAQSASASEAPVDDLDAREDTPSAGRAGQAQAQAARDVGEPSQRRPYLQIFGPDTGVYEHFLGEDTITIGRSDHADIRLPHPTVSRIHATLAFRDERYVIEDADSNYGVTVNGKRIEHHNLSHGDSIQISLYVLQFRTHPFPPGASAAAARAKFLLRSEFSMLPSTMRLSFRALEVAPREIFRTGDTLRVGHGGLLIPTQVDVGDTVCLEVQLCWPGGQSKRYLGEIMGVIPETPLNWLCVKLHTVSREIHEATVDGARPGPWIDVAAT